MIAIVEIFLAISLTLRGVLNAGSLLRCALDLLVLFGPAGLMVLALIMNSGGTLRRGL